MVEIDFVSAGRIIFGWGKIALLPDLIRPYGRKVLVIRGKSTSYGEQFYQLLHKNEFQISEFPVSQEPDLETINNAASIGRKHNCDAVISFGGGSVIDTGKAVSALLNNDGETLDYLEVVGKGKPLAHPSKPFIAVPTTAGTGSEVTKNAVISVPEKKVKVSMRSNFMLPAIALIDPEVTIQLPPMVTAMTGMDAFIQVIEPYVCNSPNPMVDLFCRDAVPRAAKYILKAFEDGFKKTARENMSWVSLMGGLSLANAKLGAVHGFAGPIGGMYSAPHGAVCAALLSPVLRINCELVASNPDYESARARYQEIACWVTGTSNSSIEDGIRWFDNLTKQLAIKKLSHWGVKEEDFSEIVEKAEKSSSMKGNPVKLSRSDLMRILKSAH